VTRGLGSGKAERSGLHYGGEKNLTSKTGKETATMERNKTVKKKGKIPLGGY